jgi:hypothetical protein
LNQEIKTDEFWKLGSIQNLSKKLESQMKLNQKLIIDGKREHELRKNEHENLETLIIGEKGQHQNRKRKRKNRTDANKNFETESRNVITQDNRRTKDENQCEKKQNPSEKNQAKETESKT